MNITVIGTGYVGLVTGVCLSNVGNKVVCLDIDEDKIELLNNGELPIYEPGLKSKLKSGMKSGNLSFTSNSKKAVELSDGLAEIKAGLGHAYGMAGRKDEARKILNELKSLAETYYIPPVQIAYVAASLDEIDETFELLEKAYIERTWDLVFIREEPWFDDFHSLPRFVDLLKRIQFPRKE